MTRGKPRRHKTLLGYIREEESTAPMADRLPVQPGEKARGKLGHGVMRTPAQQRAYERNHGKGRSE